MGQGRLTLHFHQFPRRLALAEVCVLQSAILVPFLPFRNWISWRMSNAFLMHIAIVHLQGWNNMLWQLKLHLINWLTLEPIKHNRWHYVGAGDYLKGIVGSIFAEIYIMHVKHNKRRELNQMCKPRMLQMACFLTRWATMNVYPQASFRWQRGQIPLSLTSPECHRSCEQPLASRLSKLN